RTPAKRNSLLTWRNRNGLQQADYRKGAIGFSRLPLLLESEGVLCKPKPESPADPWLRRFHGQPLKHAHDAAQSLNGFPPVTGAAQNPLGLYLNDSCRARRRLIGNVTSEVYNVTF